MSSIGNKGKFSDRLKRMKLIRYAKVMKIKVKDGFLENEEESQVKINSNIINISVDNANLTSVNNNFLVSDVVDNSKTSVIEEDRYADSDEKVSEFIKRKAVETASVGAAIVGSVGSSLFDDNYKIEDSVDNVKSLYNNVDNIGKDNNLELDNIIDSKVNTSEFIKRKAVETASVGAAIIGSVGSALMSDKPKLNSVVNNTSNFEIRDDNKEEHKLYLSAQIIKKIRHEFESNLNELEVLESELYLLNDKNENELDLERCKEIKKEIEEIISKINHIISQYNIYQHNRFLDDMLDIDDSSLVDDISDFKRLYNGEEINDKLSLDYDLVSEYQMLYSKLDDIKNNVENVVLKNDSKIVDYDKRDRKYEVIKDNIINIEEFQKNCEYYICKQNEYVDDIKSRVGKIDVDYIYHYRLKGFGDLVGGTLKYLGLLSLSPFSSLLPGIAYRTQAANMMVKNLRDALSLEKVTSTIYKVENFQFQLDDKINDINYNYYNVDRTINDIEIMVYNNREKLDLIRKKLKSEKKINENTLKKVRMLENDSKPLVQKVS